MGDGAEPPNPLWHRVGSELLQQRWEQDYVPGQSQTVPRSFQKKQKKGGSTHGH